MYQMVKSGTTVYQSFRVCLQAEFLPTHVAKLHSLHHLDVIHLSMHPCMQADKYIVPKKNHTLCWSHQPPLLDHVSPPSPNLFPYFSSWHDQFLLQAVHNRQWVTMCCFILLLSINYLVSVLSYRPASWTLLQSMRTSWKYHVQVELLFHLSIDLCKKSMIVLVKSIFIVLITCLGICFGAFMPSSCPTS